MNQSTQQNPRVLIRIAPDVNPWDEPDTLPALRLPWRLLIALIVIACAVYPTATELHPIYTLVMLLVCALAQLVFVRSIMAAVLSLIVLALGSVVSVPIGVSALCILTALSLGAYLITRVRSLRLIALPLAAYAIAFLLCRDPFQAALSLLSLPAAGLLAHTTMKNTGRVGVICATSAALGATALVAFSIVFYRLHGEINAETLRTALEAFREQAVTHLTNSPLTEALEQFWSRAMEAMERLTPPGRVPSGGSVAEQWGFEPFDRATFSSDLVNAAFAALPALLVLTSNFLALTAQTLCHHAYTGSGTPRLATRTAALFVMSVPSAIIFMVCGVIAMFTSGESIASAAIHNVAYILFPPMCLIGFFKTVGDLRRQAKPFVIVIIAVAAVVAPYALLLWLALSGAFATLMRPLVTRMLLESQKHSDNNDDKDS